MPPLDSANPFADLVPAAPSSAGANPFADLVPNQATQYTEQSPFVPRTQEELDTAPPGAWIKGPVSADNPTGLMQKPTPIAEGKPVDQETQEPLDFGKLSPKVKDTGLLRAGLSGMMAGPRGIYATGQALAGGKPAAPTAETVAEQPVHWGDIFSPRILAEKALYNFAASAPTMASAVIGEIGGAALGTEVGGPVGAGIGAVAGTVGGAALGSTLQSLGVNFGTALQETNGDSEKAWRLALQRTGIEATGAGAGFGLFRFAPFSGAVKRMMFQAFGVQPVVGVTEKAAQNLAEGKPVGEGVMGAIPGAVVGTAVPMGAHVAASRIMRGRAPPPAPPPGAQEPSPAGAPEGGAPTSGETVGVQMGDAVQPMTVREVSPEGDVVLHDADGNTHILSPADFASLRRDVSGAATQQPFDIEPNQAPTPEGAAGPATAQGAQGVLLALPAPEVIHGPTEPWTSTGEGMIPPRAPPFVMYRGEPPSVEAQPAVAQIAQLGAEEAAAAQGAPPAPAEPRIAAAVAELAEQARPETQPPAAAPQAVEGQSAAAAAPPVREAAPTPPAAPRTEHAAPATPEPAGQQPDTRPGNYYVTMVRDGKQVAYLAGPYRDDHAAALAAVERAQDVANQVDPWSQFDVFGTARADYGFSHPGTLNDRLGELAPGNVAPGQEPRAAEPTVTPPRPATGSIGKTGQTGHAAFVPNVRTEPLPEPAPAAAAQAPAPGVPRAEVVNAPTVSDEAHTQTKAPIYAVRFPQKPEIEGLGAQAKKLGGYWSAYRGGGMQPGWMFKTRAAADQFAEWSRSRLGEPPAPAEPAPAAGQMQTPQWLHGNTPEGRRQIAVKAGFSPQEAVRISKMNWPAIQREPGVAERMEAAWARGQLPMAEPAAEVVGVLANATFRDPYAGDVPIELRKVGNGYQWVSQKSGISPGYKPFGSAARAIAVARNDRRFSDVGEVPVEKPVEAGENLPAGAQTAEQPPGMRYVLPSFVTQGMHAPAQPKWREIGLNYEGRQVFEDENGVRSHLTDRNIRVTEPVGIRPTREGVRAEIPADRSDRPEFQVAQPLPFGEPHPIEYQPPETAGYGESNKIFTKDAADEARERIRRRLSGQQLNAGIDPELMRDGLTLAGYHIEAGAHQFADFARAMVADVGEAVRPYLRTFYEGVRYWPDFEPAQRMSSAAEIEEAALRDAAKPPTLSPEQQPPTEARHDNELRGTLPAGDAGAGPEDVHGVAAARPPRPASEGEGPGGAGNAPVAPPGEAEPGAGGAQHGAGNRPGDPDRVPAGGPGADGEPGAAGGSSGTGRGGTQAGRVPDADVKGQNHVIEPGAVAEQRSPRVKARDNLSAIELAKSLTAEGRAATKEEQGILARYVGWGGLSGAFPDAAGNTRAGLADVGARLKSLLTPAEYRTAARSTQYAHYTSEPVIRAMWDAVGRLGFKGGAVFEPGMGVGHFLGMMPPDIAASSRYQGLELDHVTAQIARLLYPESGVRQADFTRTPIPEGSFDLAIGNPPFGDIVIRADPKYAGRGFMLHDYFFAKSLDSVRPGGLLAFVTSAGTMNKLDDGARRYMAERAEFVGGVRLPSTAFAKNAGTEVTTDILFFKKRPVPVDLTETGVPPWTETVQRTLPDAAGNPTAGNVSRYFSEHPEMVLGEESFFDKLYKGRYAVHETPGSDLSEQLREAFGRLPEDVMDVPLTPGQKAALDFSSTEKKEGSFYVGKDGRLMQYSEGAGRPVAARGAGVEGGKTKTEMATIRQLLPVRDALREVFRHDLAGNEQDGAVARAALNKAYDAFVKQNGPLNKTEFSYRRPTIVQQESARAEAREEARDIGLQWDEGTFDPTDMLARKAKTSDIARARQAAREAALRRGQEFDEGSFDPTDMPDLVTAKLPNIDPFQDDQESYRLRALEDYNPVTGVAEKRRVFFENTLTREEEPQLKSANDGVLWSINQHGRLDLDAIAAKLGTSRGEVISELGDAIMRLPGTEEVYEPRDAYLSGDVKTKLQVAQAAADRDPQFQKNVSALEAAQPVPLSAGEIAMFLGMPWVPIDYVHQFTDSIGIGRATISRSDILGKWLVAGGGYGPRSAEWGTTDYTPHELLSEALNRRTPVVRRSERQPDGKTYTWVDVDATQEAQEKVNALNEAFERWAQADPERAHALAAIYNEKYNRVVLRQWNGDYLTTPGVSSDWSWYPHQTRAVARVIQDGNTYLAHAVGAGKTAEMIGAGMEMRRLALVNKPMYVVPNHMLGQFAKEFYEQYPTARIRVADDRNFHTSRRKQFVADVAQQDLDAIVITNSAFKKIPISEELGGKLIQEAMDEIDDALMQLGQNDAKAKRIGKGVARENVPTVKRLQNRREKLQQKLLGIGGEQDAVNTFEELGVDFLFVDEAHNFRKLAFVTQTPMKGITSEGSDMAWDLYTKIRYLDENRPGRSLVLASGTPVTNTMGELYSLSRYIQPQALRDAGLSHFDSWAQNFGATKTDIEQTAQGTYEPVTRFAKFVNMPELYKMVGSNMDIVTNEELGQYVTRPTVADGGRQLHLAPQTPWMKAFQKSLAARVEAIKNRRGRAQKGDDILLSVIGDGRKGSIDPRLVDPSQPAGPSKLMMMIDNVHRIFEETKDQPFYDPASGYQKEVMRGPATQMVFSNLGVQGGEGRVSAYDLMRREWVRRGIPAEQIAFIKDYQTPVAKQRLINDFNDGKVRILVGSTMKMGTGINGQRRLVAIHNLDPLWFPADDEQRNGRGIRQGNLNPQIQIHDYSTKGTYDSTMWAMMARKGRFIEQFFRGDPNLREMEDLGEAGQYEQAAAMATADPRVIELTQLRHDLTRVERSARSHENAQYGFEIEALRAEEEMQKYADKASQGETRLGSAPDVSGDKFRMTIDAPAGLLDQHDVGTPAVYTDRKAAAAALEAAIAKYYPGMERGETRGLGWLGNGEGFPVTMKADRIWDSRAKEIRKSEQPVFGVRLWPGEDVESGATTPAGIITSAAMIVGGLQQRVEMYRGRFEDARLRAESNRLEIGKSFPDADKIAPLRTRVAELEAQIRQGPAAEDQPGETPAGTQGQRTALGPEGEMQSSPAGLLERLMRNEEGSVRAGHALGLDVPDLSEGAEGQTVHEAASGIAPNGRWTDKAWNVLGLGPKSPGLHHHNFNFINKNWTTPMMVGSLDPLSTPKMQAELARHEYAATLLKRYVDGVASWNGKSPELWKKLFSAMELLTLDKRDVPLDGRDIIVRNDGHPHAALTKPGDWVRLTTPEEKQMFADYRRMMDQVWRDLVTETARQFGWEGEPTSRAMMAAAEGMAETPESRRLQRAARIVSAIEYQHRAAYLPLMRSGDYFLSVKPTRPSDIWNGEGNPPTVMFKLIDALSGTERALGGRQPAVPRLANEAIAELRKTFPEGEFSIEHGYMFRSADQVRDLSIPAVDKLMSLAANDVRGQLRDAFVRGGKDQDTARSMARTEYDKMVESVIDQIYEEQVAGFKRPRQGIAGYDSDFAKATGTYQSWLSNYISGIKHRSEIEAADQIIERHPDPRKRAFWRDWDRRQEDYGDQLYTPLAKMRQGAFLWLLGMNAATSAKILLHGPLRGLPMLTTGLGATGRAAAAGDWLKASRQLLGALTADRDKGIVVDFDRITRLLSSGERSLLSDSEAKGILHPQTTDEMMSVKSQGEAALTPRGRSLKRVSDIWSSNVSAADRLTRGATLLGAYRTAQREGMPAINRFWDRDLMWRDAPQKTPEAFAQFMVRKTVGIWGDFNRMPIMNNPAVGMIGQFKLYELGYLSNLWQLMAHMGPEGKVSAALMLGGIGMMGGYVALPFAKDALDAAQTVWGAISGITPDLEADMRDAANWLFGNGGEAIVHGLARGLGLDWSGIGFGDIISRSAQSPLDMFGAAASTAVGGPTRAVQRYSTGQGELAAARELMPNAVKHMLDAFYPQIAISAAKTGKASMSASDLSAGERIAMGAGFRPTSVAKARERAHEATALYQSYSSAVSTAENRIANLYARGETARAGDALRDAERIIVEGVKRGVFGPNEADQFQAQLQSRIGQRLNPQIGSPTQRRIEAARP